MRFHYPKATLGTTILAVCVLLLGTSRAGAQQQINLTAGPTAVTPPDGATVPMWGYTCGAVTTATCAKLNPSEPMVARRHHGSPGATCDQPDQQPTRVGQPRPTSLTIVGQLGGGLGTPTKTDSPTHKPQGLTWPASGGTGPTDTVNIPPAQGQRVQSFGTPVAPGATVALSWTNLRPGTYLIESGTHPSIQGPMGLYGIVVVTRNRAATTGTANPGVTYDAEVRVLLSEIDSAQNNAVATAVDTAGFSETKVWSGQPDHCGNPSSAELSDLLSADRQLLAALLPHQRCSVRPDECLGLLNSIQSAHRCSPVAGKTALVRMVNAGLRMHVPSIVGAQTGVAPAVTAPPRLVSLDRGRRQRSARRSSHPE